MRPIYHRDADRVRAHVLVAVLAFVLHRAIEKKLKAAQLDLSATEALTALKTVRVVDIDLGNGTRKRCVTKGSQRAARSEEHTSELQSLRHLVCRLLLE